MRQGPIVSIRHSVSKYGEGCGSKQMEVDPLGCPSLNAGGRETGLHLVEAGGYLGATGVNCGRCGR